MTLKCECCGELVEIEDIEIDSYELIDEIIFCSEECKKNNLLGGNVYDSRKSDYE